MREREVSPNILVKNVQLLNNYLETSSDAYCQEQKSFSFCNDFFAASILFPSGSPPEPSDLLNEQSK